MQQAFTFTNGETRRRLYPPHRGTGGARRPGETAWKGAELVALDTETTSTVSAMSRPNWWACRLPLWRPIEAFYIPCRPRGLPRIHRMKQLAAKAVLKMSQTPVFEQPSRIKKVGQNIKYDWIVLERNDAP